MGTVEIDIEAMRQALDKVDTLAESIAEQRSAARSATPIPLPSLADGTALARTETWLRDAKAEPLQLVLDIGVLLDTEGEGNVSYDGDASITGLKESIADHVADGLSNISEMDSVEDRERLTQIAEVFGRYADDPAVSGPVINELGPDGVLQAIDQLARLSNGEYGYLGNLIDDPGLNTEFEYPDEVEAIRDLQDSLASSLAIGVGSASRAGLLETEDGEPSFGTQLAENSGQGFPLATLFRYGNRNDVDFGQDLLTDAGEVLMEREEGFGWMGWHGTGQEAFPDFGHDPPGEYEMRDPTLQWMRVLDKNVDASQEILGNEEYANYLLGEREPSYEDPPGEAAGDVLRVATVDQAMENNIRGERAANISAHVISHFGGDASPQDGVKEELGGIVATYIADADRAAQSGRPGETGTYSDGEGLPDWLADEDGFPPHGLRMNVDELRGVLNDIGDNDVASATVGGATMRLNEARMQAGIDATVEGGWLDDPDIADNDPFASTVTNSAQLTGFMQDSLLDGRIDSARSEAEARKEVAELFTLPLDAIPTQGTGPLGSYVIGEIKEQITDGYVGDGVQDEISAAPGAFESARNATTLQALEAIVHHNRFADPEDQLPIPAVADDWPTTTPGGKPFSAAELSNQQIEDLLMDANDSLEGGYDHVAKYRVDSGIDNYVAWKERTNP